MLMWFNLIDQPHGVRGGRLDWTKSRKVAVLQRQLRLPNTYRSWIHDSAHHFLLLNDAAYTGEKLSEAQHENSRECVLTFRQPRCRNYTACLALRFRAVDHHAGEQDQCGDEAHADGGHNDTAG
jgi:hypothetical protein